MIRKEDSTLKISEVGVINVKLELFVLNVRIYENVLLILNLCKVSKLCILTQKELDVDFSFMNNVTTEEVNRIFLMKSQDEIFSIKFKYYFTTSKEANPNQMI